MDLFQQNAILPEGDPLPYRLEFDQPGQLSSLALNLTTRQVPGPDEVEIQVKAVGLNFRDVLKVLGMYPGNPIDLNWLGDDFSGVIVRVGKNVTDYRVGETVIGLAPYAFQTYIRVDCQMIFRKPSHLSFEDGATIPSVFLTAYYTLVHIARLQAGERILIHAATGGVGQAAIQIANHLGLEIFATASSPEKQDFLRNQGIEHIFNSRSLNFADEIMATTEGKGVDAVLNSLAGDFIPASLSVLAPFGRFLEIGKIDIYKNSKIGLEGMRNNISLHIFDLPQRMTDRPDELAQIIAEIQNNFVEQIFQPLAHTVFPITAATEAFRFMASSKHIGKNVVSFTENEILVGRMTEKGHLFRSEAGYLITGGARGFGLEVAKWAAEEGARYIVLMSRSGLADEQALADIEVMRSNGVNVVDVRGDVTKWDEVVQIIADIQSEGVPLAGVFHGAMVLNDQLLIELDDEGFNRAFHPKMVGAWNLHLATLQLELDYFVCFSSMTSVIGTTKQANYSAGNAFLDGLAKYRRSRGLPGLTINWGILSGAGIMERNPEIVAFFDEAGFEATPIEIALQALRMLLMKAGGQAGIATIDWTNMKKYLALVANTNIFEYLTSQELGSETNEAILTQILTASSEQRVAIVAHFLTLKMSEILGFNFDDTIDYEAPLASFGLDSLMAIELINVINKQLSLNIAVSDLLSSGTITDIANVIINKVLLAAEGQADLGDSVVDFDLEAALDPAIARSDPHDTPLAASKDIMLTGATGFLGAFLLHELLLRTDAKIHCLARGAKPPVERITMNLQSYGLWSPDFQDRIAPVSGDLSEPLLGLSQDQFDTLSNQVDAIYHCAAELNLLKNYTALKPENVFGVQEILRLAGQGKPKGVHYISTIGVFFSLGKKEMILESDQFSSQDLFSGYAQSKWVAEKLIHQAQARGIPCVIYRPGLISGSSQSGITNGKDFASRLVLGAYQMGLYHDRGIQMNIVPVDFVSQAITHLSTQEAVYGEVFHLTNLENIEISNVIKWSGYGDNLAEIPYQEWRNLVVEMADEKVENDLLSLLPLFPPGELENFEQIIDCQNTLKFLSGSGIECPVIDQNLIERYRNFLVSEIGKTE